MQQDVTCVEPGQRANIQKRQRRWLRLKAVAVFLCLISVCHYAGRKLYYNYTQHYVVSCPLYQWFPTLFGSWPPFDITNFWHRQSRCTSSDVFAAFMLQLRPQDWKTLLYMILSTVYQWLWCLDSWSEKMKKKNIICWTQQVTSHHISIKRINQTMLSCTKLRCWYEEQCSCFSCK